MSSPANKLDQEQILDILIRIYNESQNNHSLDAKDVIQNIVFELSACQFSNIVGKQKILQGA